MQVCVLSGSPKGENSITYQTVRYLQKKYPDSRFETLHVGQKIRAFEKDMEKARPALERAELILFFYPVYTFIAPSQLHRFLELMKGAGIPLAGKYAAQISTSKHFYDTTAHAFIRDNCQDMGLKYIGGLSEDMEDLLSEKGRREAETFWELVCWKAENDIYEKAPLREPVLRPAYRRCLEETEKKEGNETVIVADLLPEDAALAAMIQDFQAVYPYRTRLVNIREYPLAGGCLGCFHCAATGKCIYKDQFDEFLRNEIQGGAAIVYAYTVKDHSMGARMKMYDDRQFCNGHRTVTMGSPTGYLVNGDLQYEENLRTVMEGRAQVGGNYLAGIGTDARSIREMAQTLAYALEHRVILPQTFLGVGGTKIFRDLIWVMQGLMKADHKFYKEHGIYDFPQKQRGTILKMKLVGALISNPAVQKKMGNKMTEGMLAPYEKVLSRL